MEKKRKASQSVWGERWCSVREAYSEVYCIVWILSMSVKHLNHLLPSNWNEHQVGQTRRAQAQRRGGVYQGTAGRNISMFAAVFQRRRGRTILVNLVQILFLEVIEACGGKDILAVRLNFYWRGEADTHSDTHFLSICPFTTYTKTDI